MKETQYFSHDADASRDEKIIKLRIRLGWEGYGIYWAIVEKLRLATDYKLSLDYEGIAFDLQTQCERIKEVIEEYQLFKISDGMFWSESLLSRMRIKDEKSEKARNSAKLRWGDANAMRTQCGGNANKVNESKNNKEIQTIPYKVKHFGDTSEILRQSIISFEDYKNQELAAYNELIIDYEFLIECQKYNPDMDIKLSLEKAHLHFWSTEAGWKNKKKGKGGIDWKATYRNALSNSLNRVWKTKDSYQIKPQKKEVEKCPYKSRDSDGDVLVCELQEGHVGEHSMARTIPTKGQQEVRTSRIDLKEPVKLSTLLNGGMNG
jgi:hypothetical protein